jgi:enoyl-CoA hydratase/carnithine racemase
MSDESARRPSGGGIQSGRPAEPWPSTEPALVSELLGVEHDGAVAVITLNRAAARNALSSALVEDLATALARLEDDPNIRATVLTGAPPGFCAGSDLKELATLSITEMVRHEARTGYIARGMQQLGLPIVAAVEGFALGGGFLLATGCDVVISAGQARWQLPEVGLGWVPPWGLHSLVARVGPSAARRLAWGEQSLTGQELFRLGAVDELVETGEALPRARQVALRLSQLPPHAVASTKRALAEATAGAAELTDARSGWMFGLDCHSETAQTSLSDFARQVAHNDARRLR